MGIDEEYLEELLRTIEPIVNPDGEAPKGLDVDEIPEMPEEELDSAVAEPDDPLAATIAAAMSEETEEVAEPEEPKEESIDDLIWSDGEDEEEEIAAEESMADEASVEEVMAEAEPVEEVAAEEAPIDEVAAEEAPIEEVVPAEEMPTEEVPAEEMPAEEAAELAEEEFDVASMIASLEAEEADGQSEEAGGEPEEEMAMSEEEIDALLNAAKESATEEAATGGEEADIMSLLAGTGDEAIDEIQELLDSDENGVAVDEEALTKATEIEDVASEVLETKEDAKARKKKEKEEAKAAKKAAKAAKKKKKGDGDEVSEAAEATEAVTLPEGLEGTEEPKKKGFFGKIIEALTETVDEEEEAIPVVPEEGQTGISDENKEILAEVDEEKGKKKKKKKEKKKKKGKGEDAEGAEGASDAEGDEEGEGEDSKKKKKKPKKEKKPKAKEVKEEEAPRRKLPKKRVRAVFLLNISVCAAILICVFGYEKINNLHNARWAYDNQDYVTTYENLYGMELKGDDAEIYKKSQAILLMDRKYKSYQNYKKLGMNTEAVNALMEAVAMYPELRENAEQLGVAAQVDYTYASVLAALSEYGVSEADAKDIVGYESKVRYTLRVQSIANGTPFTYDDDIAAEGMPAAPVVEKKTVDDILPEEMEFLPEDPNSIWDETNPEQMPVEEAADEAAATEETGFEREIEAEVEIIDSRN